MSEDQTKWEKIDRTELSKEFLEFYEKYDPYETSYDDRRDVAWRGWCGAIEWMRSQATVVWEVPCPMGAHGEGHDWAMADGGMLCLNCRLFESGSP